MSTGFLDKAIVAARIALPLGVVVFVLAPAGAWGAADVIRNSGNNFDKPTYYSDQGDLVQYEHTGGSSHNVVSTQFSGGEPFFKSVLISSGTTPVNGTQFLAPSTYPFVCTIHSGMDAELVVRYTDPPPPGTDPPPPGTDPPPPGTDPSDTTVYKARIGRVTVKGPANVRKGRAYTYKVTIRNSGNAQARGVRPVVFGRGISFNAPVGRINAGATRTVNVKLRPSRTGRVRVTFKVVSGNAGNRTVRKTITVRN